MSFKSIKGKPERPYLHIDNVRYAWRTEENKEHYSSHYH